MCWSAPFRIALRETQFARGHLRHDPPQAVQDRRAVRVSVRRIKIAMASACPYQNEFALAHLRLATAARRRAGTGASTYPLHFELSPP